jgi:uncharacterized tellurite resistance protein B-like protein
MASRRQLTEQAARGTEVDMLTYFKKLLNLDDERPQSPSSDTETVRRIISEVDRMDPADARFIAAFAFVLARVANADMTISAAEIEHMEDVVREVGGLDEAQAVLVVQIARSQQQLMGGTENYLVTREFKRISDRGQKERLLHCLFEVSASDDSISLAEESEVRRIAEELGFELHEFSDIRSQYNDRRSILGA